MAKPPPIVLQRRLRITGWAHTIRTPIADVWKVTLPSGMAALKVYHNGEMGREAPAVHLFRYWDGRCAPRLIDAGVDFILLDWIDGSSLGDMVRAGQDEAAAQVLGEVARNLIDLGAAGEVGGLAPLQDHVAALRKCIAVEGLETEMLLARHALSELLSTQTTAVALHGDLHHDNVLMGSDGARVIDPKGVFGDPHFELANAFRNPAGAKHLLADPDRALYLVGIFADKSGLDRLRLLRWAVAKCGLSVAWKVRSGQDPGADRDTLPALIVAARQAGAIH